MEGCIQTVCEVFVCVVCAEGSRVVQYAAVWWLMYADSLTATITWGIAMGLSDEVWTVGEVIKYSTTAVRCIVVPVQCHHHTSHKCHHKIAS